MEVYIPANITFVAPGVLEKIGGLMYIEVAPDNPCWCMKAGMGCFTTREENYAWPNGR